jgi:hypothetical protein
MFTCILAGAAKQKGASGSNVKASKRTARK